mgnify:FL=1
MSPVSGRRDQMTRQGHRRMRQRQQARRRQGWPPARLDTAESGWSAGDGDQTRRSAITAFSPPKAKALDSTASTRASRATFGTTSSAHSGSGSS